MKICECHQPVMVDEVKKCLITDRNGVYVDGTVGVGGHAFHLMRALGPRARLIAIDRDNEALSVAKERLKEYKSRIHFVHSEYSQIRSVLKDFKVKHVNGVLLDLGFSSLQIDSAERGFSFTNNGPLDMRFDRSKGITAAEYLSYVSYSELSHCLYVYGEERFSRRIAKAIIRYREKKQIETTKEVAEIISTSVGRFYGRSHIHPATKTFQAIRIFINEELKHLEAAMIEIADSLLSKGRMAVISFHSAEDRMVKKYIFNNSRGCTCSPFVPRCVCGYQKRFNIILPKVIKPKEKEIRFNPRARSARLRVAEKV
ncbi:MAG: 16S rRNA (cytosine(1402)-N(4))-methyltransferase RsmH [bacterium]